MNTTMLRVLATLLGLVAIPIGLLIADHTAGALNVTPLLLTNSTGSDAPSVIPA